jgi:hypothetical protein
MRYVESFGELFKLSERKFREYIIAGAEGQEPSPRDFGKSIGVLSASTGSWNREDFQFAAEHNGFRFTPDTSGRHNERIP